MKIILTLIFFNTIIVSGEIKDTIEINSTINYLGGGNASVDTYLSILPNVKYDFRSDGIECYEKLRNIIVEIDGQLIDTNYYSIKYFDYMHSYFANIAFDSVLEINRKAIMHLRYESTILKPFEIKQRVNVFKLYISRAILSTEISYYVNYNLKINSLDTNFIPKVDLQKLYKINKNDKELTISRIDKNFDLNSPNSVTLIDFIYFIDESRSTYQDIGKNIKLVNLDLIWENWISACYGPVYPDVFYHIEFPIRKVFKLLSTPKIKINISGREMIPFRVDKNSWDSFESGKAKNPYNSIFVFDKTDNVRNLLKIGFLISKDETARIEVELEYTSKNIIQKKDAFNYSLNYGWPLHSQNKMYNDHYIKFQVPDEYRITGFAPHDSGLIKDSSRNQVTFEIRNIDDYRGKQFIIDFSKMETTKYNIIHKLNLALPLLLILLFLLIRIKTKRFYHNKIMILIFSLITAFLALQMGWYTTKSVEYFFDSIQYTCAYVPILIWLLIGLFVFLKREYPKNEFS